MSNQEDSEAFYSRRKLCREARDAGENFPGPWLGVMRKVDGSFRIRLIMTPRMARKDKLDCSGWVRRCPQEEKVLCVCVCTRVSVCGGD